MPHTQSPSRARHDLQVDHLSSREWRVCDRRIAADDARCLIGFIEKMGERYEVIEFADPIRFHVFDTLAEAKYSFVTAGAAGAEHDNVTWMRAS